MGGWLSAAIAFVVYFMTMERTASFWDCGEFLACAYKAEVNHSPGAPFFMLLQRVFSLCSGIAAWTAQPSADAAFFINLFSVIASALTILFLFWTITIFARKIVAGRGDEFSAGQILLIAGCGMTGALAYTFSDTFWFSAVEAEVYGTSSLFTALVFWAMLKWEAQADAPYADRWLVFIALLIGISIGVHLLNLLAIPAIAMTYYFRKHKATRRGIVIALAAGCAVLAAVQFGIIQLLPIIASQVELFCVNSLGMPFHSGALIFFLALIAALAGLLVYARKKQLYLVHTSVLCFTFILIGFSSYVVPIIRSAADTPVDVNNPDNIISLLPYVQREQYIHPPLFRGQDFNSPVIDIKDAGEGYYAAIIGGKDRYITGGLKKEYVYEPGRTRFFPRIWDNYEPAHARFYMDYLDLGKDEVPSAADNMSFFLGYQVNTLWWRYFMWNFAGRQNDYEGQGDARNGNWITGIPFLDKPRVGDMDKMSAAYSDNKARNELYGLPLLIGLLGMVFHFKRHKQDAFIVLLLFFFTGIAIVLYLNMNPLQPRERDYAFAGCMYAFAIWIGIGVLQVRQWLEKISSRSAIPVSIVLCLLAAPVLMAKEEWDDHDRSGKSLARDTAWNALMSCEPNAILFTQGDNDTYPLWYLQEVEGVRPDVRIVITELLNADWYIDQLNYKVNKADAVPMLWKREDYMGDKSNYVSFFEHPRIPKDRYFDLEEICRFVTSEKDEDKTRSRSGELLNFLPSRNFSLQLPGNIAADTSWAVDPGNRIYFRFPDNGAQKKQLAIMNILAANAKNGWERPVYFNGSYPGSNDLLGLSAYMRLEGIVYKLSPFRKQDYNTTEKQVSNIDVEKSRDRLLHFYRYGGADKSDVYFDEKNRIMLMSYRINTTLVAGRLVAEGRRPEAVALLDKMMQQITPAAYPRDLISPEIAEVYYDAGAKEQASHLAIRLSQEADKDITWVLSLGQDRQEAFLRDLRNDLAILNRLSMKAHAAGDSQTASSLQQLFEKNYTRLSPVLQDQSPLPAL